MSLTDISPNQSILNGTTINENIFQITVNILAVKKRFEFKCESSDTVDSVKAKIEAEADIPPHQQKLFYADALLKGDRTLAGEGCYISSEDMEISVELLEERAFTFYNSDTIDNVKAKIQEEEGMPHDEQTLIFDGEMLEEGGGRTLADYDIGMGSTIRLIRHGSMRIYVKTLTGRIWTIYVESWNRIEDVMKKIRDEVGMPPYSQRLIFRGKHLHEGYTLAHYNVQKESTLVLLQRLRGGGASEPVFITIEPLLGKTLKLKLEMASNPITEIPVPSQTLLGGGGVDPPSNTWWEYLFSFVTIKGYFEKLGLRLSWIWFTRR